MTFSKLGTDIQTGQIVELPKASRPQGLYIIGIQGTGKSGLIENLIMQDIKQQIGVCVLDPHGELIDHILARLPGKAEEDKVILLDIEDEDYPFGLNLFTCSNPKSTKAVQYVVDQIRHIFEKLLGVSTETPLILEYLLNCTHTLIANPGYTMADIYLLLSVKDCRQRLVANVTDTDVLLFWQQYEQMKPSEQIEQIASLRRRIREFLQPLTRPIVGQSTTTIDLQKIMDEGKILLVKLSPQLDSVSSLIGSLLIALLLNAAYARPTNKRRQFHVYADEFERFATEDFATLLEQARKFGIATTIAHQNRGQLNSANSKLETDLKDRSRSVGNLVVFRVNSKDADDLAGEFQIRPEAAYEEELEAERLEIREQERLEMMEVIDGEEDVKTPVNDVVGHLLRYGHTNPVVNKFAVGLLREIQYYEAEQKLDKDYLMLPLNTFLYEGMTRGYAEPSFFKESHPRTGDQQEDDSRYLTAYEMFSALGIGWYGSTLLEGVGGVPEWRGREVVAQTALLALWRYPEGSTQFRQAEQAYDAEVRTNIRGHIISRSLWADLRLIEGLRNGEVGNGTIIGYNSFRSSPVSYPVHHTYPVHDYPEQWKDWIRQGVEMWDGGRIVRIPREKWYRINIDLIEWELRDDTEKRGWHHTTWVLLPSETERIAQQYAYQLDQLIDAELLPNKAKFLAFLRELKAVMQALAVPENQIRDKSGLYQPRKQQHLLLHPEKTFAHPRKAITHPQRPYADIRNEIANQLSGLPNFTARIRITVEGQTVEHTIKTLEPEKGLYGKLLQERITRIQAQNRRDGYIRARADIEAEILQRQTSCSGSVPAQLQQPQPRHARQVPVQGKCPTCGATNIPGSRFCNQCGTKLT